VHMGGLTNRVRGIVLLAGKARLSCALASSLSPGLLARRKPLLGQNCTKASKPSMRAAQPEDACSQLAPLGLWRCLHFPLLS